MRYRVPVTVTFSNELCEQDVTNFYNEHVKYAIDFNDAETYTEDMPFPVTVVDVSGTVYQYRKLGSAQPAVFNGGEIEVEFQIETTQDMGPLQCCEYFEDLYYSVGRGVSAGRPVKKEDPA